MLPLMNVTFATRDGTGRASLRRLRASWEAWAPFPSVFWIKSPVVADTAPSAAVDATIALARRAEQLGYRRYWLARTPSIALALSRAIDDLAGQHR